MPPAAILDVDGTLVDTNYLHVIAWYRALRIHGVIRPVWRIHRHIGMGGDNLVRAVARRWDRIEAAERAGVPTIGVLTGGFSEGELREAGAVAVFESLGELMSDFDTTPLGR